MRYLLLFAISFFWLEALHAQETAGHPTSWSDFVAGTARTFRTGTNRIVVSEEPHISSNYRQWTFEAESSVNGYYIIVLYNSKFCDGAPSEYFNYGSNTGGDYTFHGACDGEYCYHLLKVKTYPGKTGNVYIKTTSTKCESPSIKLYVIQF